LTLSLPDGFDEAEVHYPPAEERSFAVAPGLKLSVYEGKLGIAAGVKVPADYAPAKLPISAQLRYQACNDTTCLPPATVTAAIEITVSDEAALSEADDSQSAMGGAAFAGEELFAGWLAQHGLVFTLFARSEEHTSELQSRENL